MGGGHSSGICTKSKKHACCSPAMCALCAGDHASNYKGFPKYKALPAIQTSRNNSVESKHCTHVSIIFSNHHHALPILFYASVANPNNSTNDHIFSKFISELSQLINLFISLSLTLFTVVLHNRSIPYFISSLSR